MIWGEIPYLFNKNPVTCIKEERVSKIFLGALRINLDPKIQDPRILGSEDLENWISGSGSIRRALKKIILTKTTYGLQLLLLTNFYLTPPSGGSLSKF